MRLHPPIRHPNLPSTPRPNRSSSLPHSLLPILDPIPSRSFLTLSSCPPRLYTSMPSRFLHNMSRPDHRPSCRSNLSASEADRSCRPIQPVIRTGLAIVDHPPLISTGYAVLQPRSSTNRPHPHPSLPPKPFNGSNPSTTNEPSFYRTGYAAYNGLNSTRSFAHPSPQPPSTTPSTNALSSARQGDRARQERLANDLSADLHARLRLNSAHPPILASHQWPPLVASRSAPRRPLHTMCSTAQDPIVGAAVEPAPVLSASKRRNLARAQRDRDLRERLPPFELHDAAFGAQTIQLCPSPEHPASEMAALIEAVCKDGIRLPGDRSGLQRVAIAFDMEWVISRVRGHENRTALVQLGGQGRTLLIQLSQISLWRSNGMMPEALRELLTDRRIVKLGVGIRNDGLKLLRDHKCGPKPFLNSYLELSFLVKAIGTVNVAEPTKLISLQKIVGDYLGVYLPKGDARISDWSRELSARQWDYAASDVVATIRVAQCLLGLLDEARQTECDKPVMEVCDLLGSLEPGLPEPEVPSCGVRRPEPVVGADNLDEWLGLQTSGSGVGEAEDQVEYSSKGGKLSGNVLPTFAVTARIREAWELWFEQEGSIEVVSATMGIKQISVAIYVSKMLIMKRRVAVLAKGVEGEEGFGLLDMGISENQQNRLKRVVKRYGICKRLNMKMSDFGLA